MIAPAKTMNHIQHHLILLIQPVFLAKSLLPILPLPDEKANRTLTTISCPTCLKVFASPSRLKQHSLVHSEERKHICPECGKKFKNKGNQHCHLLLNTKGKDFICSCCLQAATQTPLACQIHDPRKTTVALAMLDLHKSPRR